MERCWGFLERVLTGAAAVALVATVTGIGLAAAAGASQRLDTRTSLSGAPQPVAVGDQATYVSQPLPASGPPPTTPTGTVTFSDGTAVLGTVQLDADGFAFIQDYPLLPGSHRITAFYSGDGTYLPSSGSWTEIVEACFPATSVLPIPHVCTEAPLADPGLALPIAVRDLVDTVLSAVKGLLSPLGV
jgi:hypothetical protein